MPVLLATPAAAALRLRDALAADPLPGAPLSSGDVVEEAHAFDPRFDDFWAELVRQNLDRLLAVRDRPTLSWHFAGPLRDGRACILTASRNGLLRAYCVLKRQDHPPSGLRRMRLADYQTLQPEENLLPALLRTALRRCASGGIHTLELLGVGLPRMRGLDRSAPHRRKLPAWPFYYKATDPSLDADLKDSAVWDPSAFDGDATL
jgi:hypothetical protein